MENEKRLIDANLVLGRLKNNIILGATELAFLRNYVNCCPTVDAVEVVRCNDCKHSTPPSMVTQRYGEPGTLTCHNYKSPCNRRNVKSDWFCPCGESGTDG